MTAPSGSRPEARITDDQIDTFARAIAFWRDRSEALGLEFRWFTPRLWTDGSAVTGNRRDAGYKIRLAEGGYELILSVEREGDSSPSFYSRFDDAVKAVALVLGGSFRLQAHPESPLLTWRNAVAEGVDREPAGEGSVRYSLRGSPVVYCVISKYDGDEFSPALTMTVDEFNQAILDNPGDPIPGSR